MEESVELRWRKSSYSGNGGGNCVEIAARSPGIVMVRDSKNATGAQLAISGDAWLAFIEGIKHGELGL
jgi:hypothetical protein